MCPSPHPTTPKRNLNHLKPVPVPSLSGRVYAWRVCQPTRKRDALLCPPPSSFSLFPKIKKHIQQRKKETEAEREVDPAPFPPFPRLQYYYVCRLFNYRTVLISAPLQHKLLTHTVYCTYCTVSTKSPPLLPPTPPTKMAWWGGRKWGLLSPVSRLPSFVPGQKKKKNKIK